MSADSTPSKRPLLSIRFLLVVVPIALIVFFAAPWVLTQWMYFQVKARYVEMEKNKFPKEVPATEATASEPGTGGASSSEKSSGRAARDPEAIFAQRDADSNGKIEGEEISERLKGRMEQLDSDKDGALSKEEFLAGMQRSGERAGGDATANQSSNPQLPPKTGQPASNPESSTTPSDKQ
jgi:hypothetical protein